MAGPEKNPGGGAADVAPVAAPCRNITGRFAEDCGFCCTDVHLEAEGTNINDGTNVEFEIVNQTNGEHVTSANGRMNDGKVRDVQWSCRKTDGYKQGDTYTLQITAGQCQVKGENEFSIIELQDIPLETVIFNHYFNLKYRIQFYKVKNVPSIVIVIPIIFEFVSHAVPPPNRDIDSYNSILDWPPNKVLRADGPPDFFKHVKTSIESALSRRFFVRLRTCNAIGEARIYDIPLIIVLKEEIGGQIISIWKNCTRADSKNWSENVASKDDRWTWIHEAGHLLGWPDEYSYNNSHHRELKADPTLERWPKDGISDDTEEGIWYPTKISLMGVHRAENMRNDYFQRFRAWFEKKCSQKGAKWKVLPEIGWLGPY